jgi:hypothetical protein
MRIARCPVIPVRGQVLVVLADGALDELADQGGLP